MALYNKQGKKVNIPAKFNSKENPRMFLDIIEKLEPLPPIGKLFQLGERAKFKS